MSELLEAARKIADAMVIDARLWDTTDVATFLKLNTVYTRQHILTRGDFPASVNIPGTGREPIKRYRAVDVRDWAEKWR